MDIPESGCYNPSLEGREGRWLRELLRMPVGELPSLLGNVSVGKCLVSLAVSIVRFLPFNYSQRVLSSLLLLSATEFSKSLLCSRRVENKVFSMSIEVLG